MGVFITGGGGGLGYALAEGFARRGHDIALADVAVDRADAAAARVRAERHVRAVSVGCDVTSRASVESAWAWARAALGQLDVVVNAVGVFASADFLELSVADWERTRAVNLDGPFHVCQVAARDWVEHSIRGSIVNIASIAAFTSGFLGAVDYGASKAGLIGMTIHLAVGLGKYGIRANCVAPGSFYSPMSAKRLEDPAQVRASERMVPLGRIGQPEEVATAAIFLALDGTYINGVTLTVDGGTAVVM